MAIALNYSLIATGSQDKSVKIWKAVDLSLVATTAKVFGTVNSRRTIISSMYS